MIGDNEARSLGPVVRTYYRALEVGTRSVWCESKNPEEVLESSKLKDAPALVFEKLEVYEVSSGWGKWDGTKP